MGRGPPVGTPIDGGRALLDALRGAGFDVTAAGWTKPADDTDWVLYIASKEVDDRGINGAYLALVLAVRAHPELDLDAIDVKMVGPQHPIAADLLEIREGAAGRPLTRSRRGRLGDLSVDDTYVYAP